MYDCKQCALDKRLKKQNGCIRPTKEIQWETDRCYACGGFDKKCIYCAGKNAIPVYRCPRTMAREVEYIMPFFIDWHVSNHTAWPTNAGRYEQPVRLAQAFDLMAGLANKYEEDRMKTSAGN